MALGFKIKPSALDTFSERCGCGRQSSGDCDFILRNPPGGSHESA
jgi:hypothetical protein